MKIFKFQFKFYFLLFIANCILPTANSFSQGTWPWAVQANQGPIGPYNESWGLDVATDAAGNMYVAGRFYSDTVYFGGITLVNGSPSTGVQPSSDIYIVKYDPSGNVIWAKRAGGTGNPNSNTNSYPRSIAVDGLGNIYITGSYACATITFASVTLINSNTINYSANPWDYFIAKYDASGNVLWAKGAAAGDGGEEGMGVIADASGNVYVSGVFNQIAPSVSITFGSITLNNANGYFFIVKYDASGNVLWATNPCNARPQEAGIAIDPSGNNIYIVGIFWNSVNFGSTTLTPGSGAMSDGFLVKYNSSGNVVWAKQSVGSWKQLITGVAVDPSGNNVYIVGQYHQSNGITFGSITLPQKGFWDGCLVKYDAASGNALCGEGIGGSVGGEWYSNDVAVHPSGDVYVTGRARGSNPITIGSVTLQASGQDPMYVLVFDQNCNAICGDILASGGNFWNRVATGSSGNVYVAGTFIDAMQVGSTTLVSAGTSASWARMTMFAAKYVKCTSSTLAVSATQTNPTCSNPCAGTATTVPTGGTSPYTYSWNTSPVQTTQTVTGLCAGTYSVLVTDAAAATAAVTVIITQPSLLTATAAATAASCGSNNGTAAASASGGTSPYTYVWSNNSTTQQISNLIAGNYTITVTDANGCTKTATVTITQTGGPVLITSTTPQTCTQGGTAAAAAAGGSTPYTYQWCNGQTASTATGLSAGSCTIIVTDASGCSTTSTVTITSIGNIPSVSATSTPASCGSNNGTAAASASGGTVPYTYLWSNNSTTQQISNLSASNYTVTVTDASGCSQTQTVNVSQTPGPTAAVTATVINISPGDSSQLTATGGGTYSWSPATGLSCTTCANPTVTPLWGAGGLTYCVFVTDGNGCKDSACITISVESPCGDLFVPNAFSPNNDLANDIECVMINPVCVKNLTFIIYDRWGEKVFETSDVKICWDGMYKGKLMNTSVFVYFLEATLTNGEKINRKGNISLIR